MGLNLEVVLSSCIKRKKPWPRFCWLGKEKESVFLLDNKRISEINMVSGRTKKRTPKLHPLLSNVVTMHPSTNGMWLCGLMNTGELFMWNRDKDLLKTTTCAPEIASFISCVEGNATKLNLQVSGDGTRVLLVAVTGQVFLWQCVDVRDFTLVRDCIVKGNWTQIEPTKNTMLPSAQDKEACVHALFVQTEAFGDACLCTFVFTSGEKLVISCLQINWGENQEKTGLVNYSVKWATKSLLMSELKPPCQPVKSRGAIVPVLSPDCQLIAIVINQRHPQGTQVLFVSTVNFVSVSRHLGGCGCKNMEIPSKYSRSYWVGSANWSTDGLLLACVLKRGSLLMLARLGGLLTLSTSGCNIDFGPAHFLPLHPLVTYRPPSTTGNKEASMSSSSLSVHDLMRQRYSVTWHPRLFYFIVSDGYMATVVRVCDNVSDAELFKMLLQDTTVDLEKASQLLGNSQKCAKVWLDSVSDFNLEISHPELEQTYRQNAATDISSADKSSMLFFLQDEGTTGNPKGLRETKQSFFEDDSDLDGIPAGSHVEDGGHLEFASMFDTLHALNTHYQPFLDIDSDEESTVGKKIQEMEKIQSKLLTAWAFGLSMGHCVESVSSLWTHAVKCTVRLLALLHLQLIPTRQLENVFFFVPDFLKKLLYFIPWERANSHGPKTLGLIIELCKNLVQLVLTPYTESYQSGICEISSRNLSAALQIIEMVSQSLDNTYSLEQRSVWSPGEDCSQLFQCCFMDIHGVPLLKDEIKEDGHFQRNLAQPSRRLHGVWKFVYTISKKYLQQLHKLEGSEGEKQDLAVIMCKIQNALQSSGGRLEEGSTLLNYTGEHLFLTGFYTESSEILFSQLLETSAKNEKSSAFKGKRICLALLFSLLSQYHLKEAQELGDHMSFLILQRKKHQNYAHKDAIINRQEPVQCLWLSSHFDIDTAYAVVQTLGRFMASYFSNQTLYILPPHSVDVLPPIHLPEASTVERLVPLCQEEVAKAVRQQQLSETWTVEYAQDLLLLGGLLPESVWLAYHLGDWKAAVSLSLAYSCYCSQHFDFTSINKRELHLPKGLEAANILQDELKSLLSCNRKLRESAVTDTDQSVSDPVDEEAWGLLHISIQDILKASVMAGVDVVSTPLSSFLDKAKDLCSSLTPVVPITLYLPSPPLYCPQPSPNTQDAAGTLGYLTEVTSRLRISYVIQHLLLLLRSAHCCYSAAHWYLTQLRRAKHILYKIKKKYSYPNAHMEEKSFPDGLLRFINRKGHFRSKKDMDPATIQTIMCFRELCGLCWMLHVRDQFSLSCRKYQTDRQQHPEDSAVRSTCFDALEWAQRLLPFSRFLNCEDIIQDTLLSLLSELPPLHLVADTLALSFPEGEQSIRVSLREKYNSLIQTLEHCNAIDAGNETGENMMVLIQDKLRSRKKHCGRLRRHLTSLELHLWEKEMEEEDYRCKDGMAVLRQLSLGTSVSTCTLTDCGLLPLHSDGDTTDNTSEAPATPDIQNVSMTRRKMYKTQDGEKEMKTAQRLDNVITEKGSSCDAKVKDCLQKRKVKQPALPSVGSWEFELEDEEYLNFLDLFLSYLLEKDIADCPIELPLLKGFSHTLREKELHSLTFDVLTTLHRHQRDGHHLKQKNPEHPVFRAGCCFRPTAQATTQTSAVLSSFSPSQNETSFSSPQVKSGVQKGLFGHRKQQWAVSQRNIKFSPSYTSGPFEQQSSRALSHCAVAPMVELKQGIDNKLESEFPELTRLLEWMMRWADRRLFRGQHGTKREKGLAAGETVDEGVVIRVKASTPAVLTSLSLMEQRYRGLFGTGHYITHLQIPETQWIVAPVMHPANDRKVERESVDARNPTSLNTAPTDVNLNINKNATSVGSSAVKPEEQSFYITHRTQDQVLPLSVSSVVALSAQSYEVENATLEEEKHTDANACEYLSSISSEVCPETSLKLADLENSRNTHSSVSLHSAKFSNVDPQTYSPNSLESVFPVIGLNTPSLSQDAQLPCTLPTHADRLTVSPVANDQPSMVQPPQLRQRLSEDLCRLVQNINYMNLMEVLEASLAQTNSRLNVPLTNVPNVMPSPVVPPVPSPLVTRFHSCQPNPPHETPHSPVCAYRTSTDIQHNVIMDSQTSNSGAVSNHPKLPVSGGQEMAPLSVQAGSPVRNIKENLIPVSEGLLTTAEVKQGNFKNSALPTSNGSMHNNPAPLLSGLNLLQLRPPTSAPRQGFQTPKTHFSQDSSPSRVLYNGQTRYVMNRVHLVNTQHQPVPVSSQQMLIGVKEQECSPLPQSLPVRIASTPQGVRLLHAQPVISKSTVLPKLPTKTFPRPYTSISVPMEETSRIQLLQIDPHPKTLVPLQASLSHITCPIPEKMRSTLDTEQIDDDTQVQLLSVEKPSNIAYNHTDFQNSNNRQKRREKLANAVKTGVTFRPNNSIIPQETTDDTGAGTVPDDAAVPPGLVKIHEKGVLEKAFATAAELHAFASISKRPPELHDAFTNTDPDGCVHVDKAVSTEICTKTQILREEQKFVNYADQDQQDPDIIEDGNLILDGRQFISVVDLEDKSQHQDLPPCSNSQPAVCTELTAAELHVMATGVLRNLSDSQRSLECTNEVLDQTSAIHNEESVFHSPPSMEDDLALDFRKSEAEICVSTKTLSHIGLSQQPIAWFSSQMSQLDAQLAALQHIADSLETDFSKSETLANITEKPTPGPKSDKKTSSAVKRTVRLHVPSKIGWTPHFSTGLSAKEPIHTSSGLFTDIQSPPGRSYDLTELSDISNTVGDVNQEKSGLSDTVEILNQLVREGLLSPTDLDLSTSGARHQSRLDQESKSNMSHCYALPEDDRRELRIWMRKKERERLAVYQKHRKSLREMEHRPFASPTVKSSTKYPSLKAAFKPDRVLDTFNQRTMEACNLAFDLSDNPSVIQGFSDTAGTFPTQSISSLPFDDTHSPSVRDKYPSEFPRSPSFGSKEVPSNEYHKRLGIDRPVTSLPRDRLSQVTRRGMLTNRSSKPNAMDFKMSKGSPPKLTSIGRECPPKTILDRASETFRISERDESHLDATQLDNGQEEHSNTFAGTQWDWLENLSETGSSSLSKIDWAAIERMVSEET